jgi:hypothetical protein
MASAWSIAKFSSCTANGRPSSLASVSGNRFLDGRPLLVLLDSGFCPVPAPAYAEEREPLPPNVAHDC